MTNSGGNSDAAKFTVDLDRLADCVRSLQHLNGYLTDLLATFNRKVAALHTTWQGVTADSYARAHAAWSAEAGRFATAIADLAATADIAHDAYREAVNRTRSRFPLA